MSVFREQSLTYSYLIYKNKKSHASGPTSEWVVVDMKTQRDNFKEGLNPVVFYGSALVAAFIVIVSLLFPEKTAGTLTSIQNTITVYGGWYYILMAGFIFLLCIYLALSRYGDIKLGPDHSKPEYSRPTWFAMLFSAGLGIALVFYGVAEPVMHFLNPPNMAGSTPEAAKEALNITIFHWGLHAWSIYVIMALILSIYCYRHGLPLMVRSVLYPLIGDRIYGRIGDAVDIFAICGTVFGVATSMGFGAIQINAGLNHLVPAIPTSLTVQSVLIVLVTLFAMGSVVSGLNKGIKILSNINMTIAVTLMLFVLFVGDTVPVLNIFVQNMGEYLNSLMGKTFNLYAYDKSSTWIGGWTVFYWAWWFAWAPFVGMFIARISRGRTIREFVLGVLVVPTLFVALWMTVFGNSAISLILDNGLTEIGEQVSNNVSVALFVFLEQLPYSIFTQIVAVCLIVIFFVTSADSGSLVINILSYNGSENPPTWLRVFWTSTIGVIAFVLLYAGGLGALQTMIIVSALPVSIILLFAIYGLFKVLIVDYHKQKAFSFTAYQPQVNANNWRSQLQNISCHFNKEEAHAYLNKDVIAALQMVAEEAESFADTHKLKVSIERGDEFARLIITNGSDYDFCYAVHLAERPMPVSMQHNEDTYYRAEVHLAEGGKDYCIMGWSQDSLICDVLSQYQKHMHFLHNVSQMNDGSSQPGLRKKQRDHYTPGLLPESASADERRNNLLVNI